MGSFRSKEDDVNRISTSVFVTSFPESFTAKDLFHTCKQYGHVVHSFIPEKRSKNGKRFGFVRFINVFNLDRLVSNLCTIWIGRLKIHANVARFHRTSAKGEYPHVKKANDVNTYGRKFSGENDKNNGRSFVNVLKDNNGTSSMETDSKPAIVLDDDCVQSKDLSQSLMGRVKEFASISNLMSAFNNEGFSDITIRYLGELWVMVDFDNSKSRDLFCENTSVRTWFSVLRHASDDFVTESRIVWVEVEGVPFKLWSDKSFKCIADKWGILLDVDDKENKCYHSKRLCIISKIGYNIFESFKIVFRGKVYLVRAKEVPGWVPEFVEDSDDSDEEDLQMEEGFMDGIQGEQHEDKNDGNNKSEEVPETVFDESAGENRESSKDPFDIYPLLNKEKRNRSENDDEGESIIKYPPGFTPNVETNVSDSSKQNGNRININVDQNGDVEADLNGMDGEQNLIGSRVNNFESGSSGRFKVSEVPRNGGSLLCLMEELVKIGHTMGYNMEGCTNDITKIIDSQGEAMVNR
ncbi:nucleotide-binding alpha-beta plait domain-containing protein [Tanacetum coccineum]